MLATSPGPGGAKTVLNTAIAAASFFGGEVKGSLSVPRFYDVFDSEAGRLTDDTLNGKLLDLVSFFNKN